MEFYIPDRGVRVPEIRVPDCSGRAYTKLGRLGRVARRFRIELEESHGGQDWNKILFEHRFE